jgi:hypothetical protein
MICPHCKKSQLVTYSNKDILNNVAYKKSICDWCDIGNLEVQKTKTILKSPIITH